MFSALRRAHGAGYRAGMAPVKLITGLDGFRYIVSPENPYKARRQWLLRLLWDDAMITASLKRLRIENNKGKGI